MICRPVQRELGLQRRESGLCDDQCRLLGPHTTSCPLSCCHRLVAAVTETLRRLDRRESPFRETATAWVIICG